MMIMEPFQVLKHPSSTEKSIRLMEAENKLVFIVERKATKKDIRDAFETAFKIRPVNVNTFITPQGRKKAFIKLPADKPAIDIAAQLGIM